MPTTQAVARKPLTLVRTLRRVAREVVLIVRQLKEFFTAERDNNCPVMPSQPVNRTSQATGLSCRTVIRIENVDYADIGPLSWRRERRARQRRIPTKDISRVRETAYAQYADKSVPTCRPHSGRCEWS